MGRIWTVGSQLYHGSTTVSIVDPVSLRSRIVPLPGTPQAIVAGPDGAMYSILARNHELVRLDGDGKVVDQLRLPETPFGLDIRGHTAATVTRAPGNIDSSINLVDLKTFRITKTRPLGTSCKQAWEIIFVADRLVATCDALPGVEVLDAESLRPEGTIRMPDVFGHFEFEEQPRGLVVVRHPVD